MSSLIKHSGQVFTPEYLVNLILDEAGYMGSTILGKHCIDNSCGDGAFLSVILQRYAKEYKAVHGNSIGLSEEIVKFIHGIELDPIAYKCCLENLSDTCAELGLENIKIDIINTDALSYKEFDNKMDFVIGNPPYVRVHNLDETYDIVKSYSFAADGMTDLFLVFFEVGFNMLKKGGVLSYITPSSWLNSLAGSPLRNYIRRTNSLRSLIDIGHFQPFKATTYTLISTFVKAEKFNVIDYYDFDEVNLNKKFVEKLSLSEIDINSYFYLADHATLTSLKDTILAKTPKYVIAKNGFATLADNVFIGSDFPFSEYIIPTIKASTGKWYKAFFPYDKYGKPIAKEILFQNSKIVSYLSKHKEALLKRSSEDSNPYWFLFGRTQALKDVSCQKYAINTTIKDIKSLKLNIVPKGSGIYSGLYILSCVKFETIQSLIKSQHFINYIASLKKYKSGGYYTFNSKDLELFLNFHIHKLIENGTIQITPNDESGLFSQNY